MQWTEDGLWVVDQVLDDAHLLDDSGNVLSRFRTITENSSGVTVGGGYLWTASNGTTKLRQFRPTDTHKSAILKLNPLTGESLGRFPAPSEGVHGIEWDNGLMWVTAFNPERLVLVDPTSFKVIREFLVQMKRPHGIALDGNGIWCAHTTDKAILKYHKEGGQVLERVNLPKEGPAPHGLSIKDGELWCCNVALEPTFDERSRAGIYRIVITE